MLPMINRNSFFPSISNDFFGRDLPAFFTLENETTLPSVNILDGKEDILIEVAAPGLEKEDFKVNLHNNVLTISSEKQNNEEENDSKFMRKEFSFLKFSRSFSLPQTVNTEKINAMHKNGVLSIRLPKKDEAKEKPSRQIAIA